MGKKSLSILVIGLFSFSSALFSQTWSPLKQITWSSGLSDCPRTSTRLNNIYLVWQDDSPGNYEIFFKKSGDLGTSWSATKRLTWNGGESANPRIVVDSNGVLHVFWHDNSPGNFEIFYKKSTDDGATWSALKRLTWTAGKSQYPATALDSTNKVYVLWLDEALGDAQLFGKYSTNSGDSWSATQIITYGLRTSSPSIYIDLKDKFHVTYSKLQPGGYEIFYKQNSVFSNLKSTSPKQMTYTSDNSTGAKLVMDSSGTLHMVWLKWHWEASYASSYGYYRISTDGGTNWGSPSKIAPDYLLGHNLAIDSNDHLHYLYSRQWNWDFPSPDIYYRSKDVGTGGSWSFPITRLTWNLLSNYPTIVIDVNDDIHVFFKSYKGGTYQIFYKKGTI